MSATDQEVPAADEPVHGAEEDGRGFRPTQAMRTLLATLSFAAGAIHLAMVPQHAEVSARTGLAFAAAGWFQIAFGAVVIARPTRRWVQAAVVGNLLLVAAWALSRTAGLPSWTGGGGVEEAQAIDTLCVAFEIGLVIGAVVLLARPRVLEDWKASALTVASIVPVVILVATTAVLASPGATHHVHGGTEENAHGGTSEEASSHEHAIAAEAEAPHEHPTEEAGSGSARGHQHEESSISLDELPADTRAEVDQVIDRWADRYPTAAEAAAAGWIRGTPSLYGIGAHYYHDVNGLSVAAPFDMLNPNILLYDGDGPDAAFAGVSYVVADDVEGFTGDYDYWHAHSSVCIGQGGITLTEEDSPYWYSEAECTAAGNRVMPLVADQMIHLWIGDGYTDAPIFAHDNPELYDGYYPKAEA